MLKNPLPLPHETVMDVAELAVKTGELGTAGLARRDTPGLAIEGDTPHRLPL